MEIALIVIAFILLLAGILGAVVPGLPGPPLSYAGLILLQWSGFFMSGIRRFSVSFLLIWSVITIIVTVMDYFLPSMLIKRFGGSRYATVGSMIGLVAGIFFFPPWGLIFGPFLGAFAGELIHNRSDGTRAFVVASGALCAFIAGTGAKLAAGSIMLFYAVKAMF